MINLSDDVSGNLNDINSRKSAYLDGTVFRSPKYLSYHQRQRLTVLLGDFRRGRNPSNYS